VVNRMVNRFRDRPLSPSPRQKSEGIQNLAAAQASPISGRGTTSGCRAVAICRSSRAAG